MTSSDFDEIVARLKAGLPEERRSAARELLGRVGPYRPMPIEALAEAAKDDGDFETRVIASRALVKSAWLTSDLGHAITLIESGLADTDRAAQTAAAEVLLRAVAVYKDPVAAAHLVEPLVVSSIARAKTQGLIQAAGRMALGSHGKGVDVGDAIEGLARRLADEPLRATCLNALHELSRRRSVAAAVPALERRLGGNEARLVATILALSFLRDSQGDRFASLLSHPSLDVREGAARAAMEGARGLPGGVAVGIPALTAALSDTAGGVVWHAFNALRAAAAGGTDITGAVPALEGALATKGGYSREGWSEVLDIDTSSDVAHGSPAEDAAAALAYHRLNRGEVDAVAPLLGAPPGLAEPDEWPVRRAALAALRSTRTRKDAGNELKKKIDALLAGKPVPPDEPTPKKRAPTKKKKE